MQNQNNSRKEQEEKEKLRAKKEEVEWKKKTNAHGHIRKQYLHDISTPNTPPTSALLKKNEKMCQTLLLAYRIVEMDAVILFGRRGSAPIGMCCWGRWACKCIVVVGTHEYIKKRKGSKTHIYIYTRVDTSNWGRRTILMVLGAIWDEHLYIIELWCMVYG